MSFNEGGQARGNGNLMYAIEAALVMLSLGLALAWPRLAGQRFAIWERGFAEIARRRRLAIAIAGFTALGLRGILLPIEPIPQASTHDEFSYLLAADTFAHGRITNPTHPMWIHFESFHIIQQPTYASMYYPAQGMLLAFGKIIFGHPFWGIWLSVGMLCAAICWMLQGFVPTEWALLGALLASIRLGSFSYWANSYWGGNLAAIGGALVLGAVVRLKCGPRIRDSFVFGIGLALLANTRPYESFFFGLPICAALLLIIWRSKDHERRRWFGTLVIPVALVLTITGAGMSYYFWRVTGSPIRTPFMVNLATYNAIPYFPWQPIKTPPQYHHAVMRDFYVGWWRDQYELGRHNPVLLASLKAVSFWLFFLGPVFSLPLLIAPFLLPFGISYREIPWEACLLLLVCATTIFGLMLPVYFNPHYAAPITGAIYALILLALRRVRQWEWRGRSTGVFLSRAVPVICGVMLLVRTFAPQLHVRIPPQIPPRWCSQENRLFARAQALNQLSQYPGGQLAIVRYKDDHYLHREWVYNDADIDNAKIIWARDMGAAQNDELVRYFQNRRVWLVDADETPPRLSSYVPDSGDSEQGEAKPADHSIFKG